MGMNGVENISKYLESITAENVDIIEALAPKEYFSYYHMNWGNLAKMKELTNDMCREKGLSVAKKGRRFDGTINAPPGTVITWSKDKYRTLIGETGKSRKCRDGIVNAIIY